MKKLITILIIAASVNLTAQVGIGTNNPDSAAMLEAASNEKGFLPPRMTTAQRDAINGGNPSAGLVIYNLDIHCLEFFNATEWVSFCDNKYRLGGSEHELLNCIAKTSDGGFIVGLWSSSSESGDVTGINNGGDDYWIVKFDASGNREWDKLYGGDGYDEITSIIQTTDGGYIASGYTNSSVSGNISGPLKGDRDIWVVKLNASGNIEWDKIYGGDLPETGGGIVQTPDGGYILSTSSASSTSGDISGTNHGTSSTEDVWVVKLDVSGNIQWEKLYGGNGSERASINPTADGGYIMIGNTGSSASGDVSGTNHGDNDIWIVKLDALGNIQWQKLYGGNGYDTTISFQITPDNGYIVAGTSSSATGDVAGPSNGLSDCWILKLDSSGNIQWQKLYGGSGYEGSISVVVTTDGGYMLAAYSTSSASGNVSGINHGDLDYWLVKMDVSGNIEWEKLYGGVDYDMVDSVIQTDSGGYVVAGSSTDASAGTGDQTGILSRGSDDGWIIYLDQNGNIIEP